KFKWSMRNNTNFMESGVLAALQYAASNRSEMLHNFWRRGQNSVRKGETSKPYAIVIPEKQDDKRRLARLINLLREHAIEVQRATEPFKIAEGEYPAGTFVVRLDQPYRGFALDLLTPQKYPIDKAPYDAYDDVAWALPVALGIETKAIEDATVRNVKTSMVTELVSYKGQVAADAAVYLIRDSGQEAFLQARVRLGSFKVEAAETTFSVGGKDYPAGSWIVTGGVGLRAAIERVAADLALDVDSVSTAPDVKRHLVDLPRLAVLQSWDDTQAAGWVRMIFDDQKIPYTLIMDEDVRKGALRERFDLILFPATGASLKSMAGGMDTKFSPLAYTKTPQFPTQGGPTSSADITGGFTWPGIQNIDDFVRRGGVLVTLGGATTLPVESGMVRDIRRATAKNLANPGSELRVRFRRVDHPLSYGYPETTSVFRAGETLYDVRPVDSGRVVLQWGTALPKGDEDDDAAKSADEDKDDEPKEPPIVVSGGIKGSEDLVGKPALMDIEVGKGRVIAFGFDPIHRYQTESDFRLVWNAILNWNDLPPNPPTR
ncbi:MAG: hypothetical protein ABI672_09865, partial [Vicinamibacteria bacterium]